MLKHHLKLPNGDQVPMCPQAVMTRWNTYTLVAIWLVQYYPILVGAIEVMRNKAGGLPPAFVEMAEQLKDAELMVQCGTLAEFGSITLTNQFLWAESNGGFHSAEIHDHVCSFMSSIADARLHISDRFQVTLHIAEEFKMPLDKANETILKFLDAFGNYHFLRVKKYWEAPLVFAELGHPQNGRAAAARLLAVHAKLLLCFVINDPVSHNLHRLQGTVLSVFRTAPCLLFL